MLSKEPHLARNRGCGAGMISGDHRDLDVGRPAGSQGLGDVWSGRVLEPDQGQQGQPSLGVALGLAWVPCAFGHRQHPAAALGKIVDDLVRNRPQAPAEDGFRRTEDNGAPGDDNRAEHPISCMCESKLNRFFRL
jgi:hypothetical protein